MTAADQIPRSITVIGKGDACQPQPELFDARLRAVVRYADPAAWISAAAVAKSIAASKEIVSAASNDVGVILTCDKGPQEAMQAIDEATLAGFSSPIRYPAANPGSLVGVTCILHGFRGPTLNFVMAPAVGVPISLAMAASWLQRGVCRFVVVTACAWSDQLGSCARSLLLGKKDAQGTSAEPMSDNMAAWLRFDGV